ncbi:MAG: hypothetical protein AAGE59_32415 [Cyanobacteria bacterium P01_F01_bin.86]
MPPPTENDRGTPTVLGGAPLPKEVDEGNPIKGIQSKGIQLRESNDPDPPVVPQGDAPTSQAESGKNLSEDSAHQLGVLENQQTTIPDRQNEEAEDPGKKRKGKKSAGKSSAKKITVSGFERLRLVYNEYKPEMWPECEKRNDKRMGYADRLYQDCERDIEQCEVVLQAALEYAETSDWWNGRNGRYTGGGFGTVFMKRRYQEFAEARAMQLRNKASPGPSTTPANAEVFRLYQNTLRAIGA